MNQQHSHEKDRGMKIRGLGFMLFLTMGFMGHAQTRYFEFATKCGHGNWRDTSFIAAASNHELIDSVLANLARPLDQRNFINGTIDYGNGGHNHNANHWFLWHFIPDQWRLVNFAIEVCDGCPYSDIDADTAYWVGTVGQFCPWSGQPVREVSDPALGINVPIYEIDILLYPNPAKDELHLKWNGANQVSVKIYNALGQEVSTYIILKNNAIFDLSALQNGLYFLEITDGIKTGKEKFIIDRN